MILQVITPHQESFNLPVSLPKDYLGKQVHCLFYIEEEAKNISITSPPKKKPSDFFGILTTTESKIFDQHLDKIRGEWNRSI